jgi:hypothetical protein
MNNEQNLLYNFTRVFLYNMRNKNVLIKTGRIYLKNETHNIGYGVSILAYLHTINGSVLLSFRFADYRYAIIGR